MVDLKYKLLFVFSIVLLCFIASAEAGATNVSDQKNYTNNYLSYIFSAKVNITGSCTLYGNWSGSWAKNQTLDNVTGNTFFNYTIITFATSEKNYFWGINCSNATYTTSSWGTNYTFIVDGVPPVISNIVNYTTNRLTYNFSAQTHESGTCTLYGNWSGTWIKNETKAVTAATQFTFTPITFTRALTNSYLWGLNCSDFYGNTVLNWSTTNFTFQTDGVAPLVTNLVNYTRDSLTYIFSARSSETGSCELWGNWSGAWVLNQTVSTTANTAFNFTNSITFRRIANSYYFWNVNCSDLAGNTNMSASSNVSFLVDGKPPAINTVKNLTVDNATYFYDVISNETGSCTLWGDWSGSWAANETKAVLASTEFNFTAIQFTTYSRRYNWTVNCSDVAGNIRWAAANYTTLVGRDIYAPRSTINLTLTAQSALNKVVLTWEAVTLDSVGNTDDSELKYVIWRIASTPANYTDTPLRLGFSNIKNITGAVTTSDEIGVTSSATYHYLVTTADDGGNSNLSVKNETAANNIRQIYLTYTAPVADTSTGSSGGGSGSGGVDSGASIVSTTAPTIVGTKQSKVWDTITVEKPISMLITKADFAIKQIDVSVKDTVSNAGLTVTQLIEQPATTTELDHAYKYFNIEGSNLAASLDKAKIKFSVEKSWLTKNGLDANGIMMYKFKGTEWMPLATMKVSEDDKSVQYEAETTTFSYYAIGGKQTVAAETPATPATTETAPVAETESSSYTWLWALLAVAVVGGLVWYFYGRDSKPRRK